MSDDIFQGYKGRALELLKKYKVRVWDKCVVETTRGKFEGTLLPRSENDDDLHIVMKIITGHSDIAEVMVCMFGPTSDEYGFLHQGTRVRKMHSSYRSTFRTIGDTPIKKDIIIAEKIRKLASNHILAILLPCSIIIQV